MNARDEDAAIHPRPQESALGYKYTMLLSLSSLSKLARETLHRDKEERHIAKVCYNEDEHIHLHSSQEITIEEDGSDDHGI